MLWIEIIIKRILTGSLSGVSLLQLYRRERDVREQYCKRSDPRAPVPSLITSFGSYIFIGSFLHHHSLFSRHRRQPQPNLPLFKLSSSCPEFTPKVDEENLLGSQLQSCDSTNIVPSFLSFKIKFENSSCFLVVGGDDRLMKWLDPSVNVLNAFSAAVSGGMGPVL